MIRRRWAQIGGDVKAAAIEWQVRLASGDAAAADYQAFAEWLSRDSVRADAYAAAERLAGRLEALDDSQKAGFDGLIELGAGAQRPSARPINRIGALAALAASLALVIGLAMFLPAPSGAPHEYAAAADALRTVRLKDGTDVVLAPGARLTTSFTRNERKISSIHGVVYFKVAHDENRPFTIGFGARKIRVTGTQFEVYAFDNRRSIAVAEGVVMIETKRDMTPVRLSAGEQLLVNETAPEGIVRKVPVSAVGSWRGGFLYFDGADIDTMVDKLNAFYGDEVFIASDDDWSDASFSGNVKLSDATDTAQSLSELFPLEAAPTEDGFVLSRKDSD